MSEGRTWSSEDTQPYSFKVFFRFRLLLDCPNYLRTALMNVADLEAECIVFGTEGLLLAHDFISDCGIRINVGQIIRSAVSAGKSLAMKRIAQRSENAS